MAWNVLHIAACLTFSITMGCSMSWMTCTFYSGMSKIQFSELFRASKRLAN